MTIEDLVRLTKLSKRKLQMEVAVGALGHVKFGRSVRFRPRHLEDYIQSRSVCRRKDRSSSPDKK